MSPSFCNRVTENAAGTLTPIFNADEVKAGFEITQAFVQETGTFIANRTKEAETLDRELKQELAQGDAANEDRVLQLAHDLQAAKDWLSGGTNRLITTAVLAAAGGNVTASAAEFAVISLANRKRTACCLAFRSRSCCSPSPSRACRWRWQRLTSMNHRSRAATESLLSLR